MATPQDIEYMSEALALAEKAAALGEVPVGAVVVRAERIVGRGYNQPISTADPTAHAEVMALRDAAQQLGNYRLPGCKLYVTIEPCTMCAGAIVHARIDKVFFGAFEPKAGAVVSCATLLDSPYLNHQVGYEGGVCEDVCGALISDFFQHRRLAAKRVKQEAPK